MYSEDEPSPLIDSDRVFSLQDEADELAASGRFDEAAYRRILQELGEAQANPPNFFAVHQLAVRAGLIPSFRSILLPPHGTGSDTG